MPVVLRVKQTLLAPVRVTACMHMFDGASIFGVTAVLNNILLDPTTKN